MSIADLVLAVEAAQAQTDHLRAVALTFAECAMAVQVRLADPNLTDERRQEAESDVRFAIDQANAANQDYHTAALAELTARRELDEARKAGQS